MSVYNIKGFDTINNGDVVVTECCEYRIVSIADARDYVKQHLPKMEQVAETYYFNDKNRMYGVAYGLTANVCSWTMDGNGEEKILDILGVPPEHIAVAIETATALNMSNVNGQFWIVLRSPLGNFTIKNGGEVTYGTKKQSSKNYPRFSKNLFEGKAKALMMYLKLATFKY